MFEGGSGFYGEDGVLHPASISAGINLYRDVDRDVCVMRERQRAVIVQADEIRIRYVTFLHRALHPGASVTDRFTHLPQVVYRSGPEREFPVFGSYDVRIFAFRGEVDSGHYQQTSVRSIIIYQIIMRADGSYLCISVGIFRRQFIEGAVAAEQISFRGDFAAYSQFCILDQIRILAVAERKSPPATEVVYNEDGALLDRNGIFRYGKLFFHHLSRLLQQMEERDKAKLGQIDRKLKRIIDEKKQAQGLRQG